MDSKDVGQLEREFHELVGTIDAISALKEELELRLEEARARNDMIQFIGSK